MTSPRAPPHAPYLREVGRQVWPHCREADPGLFPLFVLFLPRLGLLRLGLLRLGCFTNRPEDPQSVSPQVGRRLFVQWGNRTPMAVRIAFADLSTSSGAADAGFRRLGPGDRRTARRKSSDAAGSVWRALAWVLFLFFWRSAFLFYLDDENAPLRGVKDQHAQAWPGRSRLYHLVADSSLKPFRISQTCSFSRGLMFLVASSLVSRRVLLPCSCARDAPLSVLAPRRPHLTHSHQHQP